MDPPTCFHGAVLGASASCCPLPAVGECMGKKSLYPACASAAGTVAAWLCERGTGLAGSWLWEWLGSAPRCRLYKCTSCSNPVPQSQGDTWGDSSPLWTPVLVGSALTGVLQESSAALWALLLSLSCNYHVELIVYIFAVRQGLNLHCQAEMGTRMKPKMGSEVLEKQHFFWNLGHSTIPRLEIVSSELIGWCLCDTSEWSLGSSQSAADPL